MGDLETFTTSIRSFELLFLLCVSACGIIHSKEPKSLNLPSEKSIFLPDRVATLPIKRRLGRRYKIGRCRRLWRSLSYAQARVIYATNTTPEEVP